MNFEAKTKKGEEKMSEQAQSDRKPQVGEWWEIQPGTGHSARYCKIEAASQENPDSFIVKSIDEDESSSYGFYIRVGLVSRFDLDKLATFVQNQTPEEALRGIYGSRAKELFEKDLALILVQIQ